MKILLSPAKSLDFKSDLPTSKTSSICFEKEAQYLNSILKSKRTFRFDEYIFKNSRPQLRKES